MYSVINSINVRSNCSVLIYAEADKDSTEDEKTENEQPAEKQKKERPSSCDKVDKMFKFIYSRDTSDRIRTRAMLCHVYHHALHDRWFEARDLMLMSHLQETIKQSDIPTQVCVTNSGYPVIDIGLLFFNKIIILFRGEASSALAGCHANDPLS